MLKIGRPYFIVVLVSSNLLTAVLVYQYTTGKCVYIATWMHLATVIAISISGKCPNAATISESLVSCSTS